MSAARYSDIMSTTHAKRPTWRQTLRTRPRDWREWAAIYCSNGVAAGGLFILVATLPLGASWWIPVTFALLLLVALSLVAVWMRRRTPNIGRVVPAAETPRSIYGFREADAPRVRTNAGVSSG